MDRGELDNTKMFTLKKWNAVAMWSWDVECDTCAICRVQVMDACLRCQAESKQDSRYGKQDCVVVWGDCNHSFHYCCMSLWVKQNNRIMGEEESRASAAPQDKLAVYGAVSAACEDVGKTNSLVGTFSVEKDAKLLIAELVYKKLEDAAEDIEAFAGHAKRNNINTDDIKLLFRKNKNIVEMLKSMEEAEEKEKPPTKRKRTEPEPSAS